MSGRSPTTLRKQIRAKQRNKSVCLSFFSRLEPTPPILFTPRRECLSVAFERVPGRSPTKFPETSRGGAPANPCDKHLRLQNGSGRSPTKSTKTGQATKFTREQVLAQPDHIYFRVTLAHGGLGAKPSLVHLTGTLARGGSGRSPPPPRLAFWFFVYMPELGGQRPPSL